ncbi:hypothetical protein CBOM_07324 [Ceraceosorus bombacis]|uniref:Uncharacterized protein n=1 Tax=Ceraceosorus bombacis TaxID=401625 RepID=A0A0P1B8F0_9BASI|nr:hypothetical protein CBOM_07324 [Ceraceosorus bombacis]
MRALTALAVLETLATRGASTNEALRGAATSAGLFADAHLVPASHVNRAGAMATPLNVYWSSFRARPDSAVVREVSEKAVLFHAANFHPDARLARITRPLNRGEISEPEPYATMELYDKDDKQILGSGLTSKGEPYTGHRAYTIPGTELRRNGQGQPVMYESDETRSQPKVHSPQLTHNDFVAMDHPDAKRLRDSRVNDVVDLIRVPRGARIPLKASHAAVQNIPAAPLKDSFRIVLKHGQRQPSATEQRAIRHYVSKYHPDADEFVIKTGFRADEQEPVLHLKGTIQQGSLGEESKSESIRGLGVTSTGKRYRSKDHRVYLPPGQSLTTSQGKVVLAQDPGDKAIIYSTRNDIAATHTSIQRTRMSTRHPDQPKQGPAKGLPWVRKTGPIARSSLSKPSLDAKRKRVESTHGPNGRSKSSRTDNGAISKGSSLIHPLANHNGAADTPKSVSPPAPSMTANVHSPLVDFSPEEREELRRLFGEHPAPHPWNEGHASHLAGPRWHVASHPTEARRAPSPLVELSAEEAEELHQLFSSPPPSSLRSTQGSGQTLFHSAAQRLHS